MDPGHIQNTSKYNLNYGNKILQNETKKTCDELGGNPGIVSGFYREQILFLLSNTQEKIPSGPPFRCSDANGAKAEMLPNGLEAKISKQQRGGVVIQWQPICQRGRHGMEHLKKFLGNQNELRRVDTGFCCCHPSNELCTIFLLICVTVVPGL